MVDHSSELLASLGEHVDLRGRGLEVAPYYQPLLTKDKFNICYTDYIDNAAIALKGAQNPELKDCKIPLIDFVWHPEKPIRQCMPDDHMFDFVVASHVMEHVANPLGWLTDLLTVMNVGGRVALFLPDRRFSGDYFRKETDFGELLGLWIEQPKIPTVSQVVDFMSKSLSITHGHAPKWSDPDDMARIEKHYPIRDIISTGIALYNDAPYIDVHCSVWTSSSFEAVFKEVTDCEIIGAKLVHVTDDEGEFLAVLEKTGSPAFYPPDKKNGVPGERDDATKLDGIDHLLGVVHHDLSFLIAKMHEAASSTYRIERYMEIQSERNADVVAPNGLETLF